MYCEHCGLQLFPKHPVCTRCGEAPTLQLWQLTSLFTLFLAVLCNSYLAWFLLPHFTASHRAPLYFRTWLWLSQKGSLYGWAPLALGLLAWEYFIWRKTRLKAAPKVRGWLTRKVLTFVIVAGITPFIPWWIPAGQPPQNFMTLIGRYPGLPAGLAWLAVLFVIVILCLNAETRLALLGRGRILSALSLTAIALLMTMTVIGWSLAS